MTDATPLLASSIVCAALVAFADAPRAEPPATAPDDRVVSVGSWDVVAVEWEGKPVDPGLLSMLQVAYKADGRWAVLFKRMPVAEGRSTNHQDVSPKTFEMETLGSERIEPRRYVGIYKFDGDTRTLCIAAEGQPRPDDFTAGRRSGRMLVSLRRAAPR
jgi:uncharacterized protein (TIGR03067 family)